MTRALLWACLALTVFAFLGACSGDDDDASATPSPTQATTGPAITASPGIAPASPGGSAVATLSITSSAFQEGGNIPREFSCDGGNASPPVSFGGVPSAAKGLVLVVEDPDAPRGTFDHWVVYAIPVEVRGFPAGASPSRSGLPGNAFEGLNGSGKSGYTGPCPPAGPAHRYVFHLYAVDVPLAIGEGRSKAEVLAAIKGHVVAEATLTGRYGR